MASLQHGLPELKGDQHRCVCSPVLGGRSSCVLGITVSNGSAAKSRIATVDWSYRQVANVF